MIDPEIKARLDKLLDSERMSEMRGALMMLNVVDIADYMDELDKGRMLKVYRILPKDISADVFAYLSDEQKQKLMESIGDSETARLISDMFIDDAVDFLEELPANLVRRVLANVNEEQRRNINTFLQYPDNSAGSIMTMEFCDLHAGLTAGEAIKYIRTHSVDKETIYTIYVLDSTRHLMGTLPLRKLLLSDENTPIESLISTSFIYAHTLDDQEQVAELVRKYDLMSVPILDTEDRMVGIVTADDIMDVIEQEATEDIEKMNALLPSEDDYIRTSPVKLAKNRLPWLLFMMVSSILTETIIDKFSLTVAGGGTGRIIVPSKQNNKYIPNLAATIVTAIAQEGLTDQMMFCVYVKGASKVPQAALDEIKETFGEGNVSVGRSIDLWHSI